MPGVKHPPAPQGMTLYAVGDIHGRLDLLEDLFRNIDTDKARFRSRRAVEIYLGDYIDRGGDPAGVVDRLMCRAREVHAIFLRGNHEQLLLDFTAGQPCLDAWKSVGAIPTLLSYGVPPSLLMHPAPQDEVRHALQERLPKEHLDFFSDTGCFCDAGGYLFVHAGIRPGVDLNKQVIQDFIGIREEFLEFKKAFNWIVVHGHTPVMEPDFRSNRINIDTGAYATNRLTCLRIGEGGPCVLNARPEFS
jgi:serine/threonine protein phosphatase 1